MSENINSIKTRRQKENVGCGAEYRREVRFHKRKAFKGEKALENSKEEEVTLLLTVSQYVLVSSTLVGVATRCYFLSEGCCLKFAVLLLLGVLSDERTGLQFAV
jgi:hypothetical protein